MIVGNMSNQKNFRQTKETIYPLFLQMKTRSYSLFSVFSHINEKIKKYATNIINSLYYGNTGPAYILKV